MVTFLSIYHGLYLFELALAKIAWWRHLKWKVGKPTFWIENLFEYFYTNAFLFLVIFCNLIKFIIWMLDFCLRMRSELEKIIDSNYSRLASKLDSDSGLLNRLLEREVITSDHMADIKVSASISVFTKYLTEKPIYC